MTSKISIPNLTSEQVAILDHLWTLNTQYEIEQFKAHQPLFRRQEVDTLIELVRLQVLDDLLDQDDTGNYFAFENLIKQMKNT